MELIQRDVARVLPQHERLYWRANPVDAAWHQAIADALPQRTLVVSAYTMEYIRGRNWNHVDHLVIEFHAKYIDTHNIHVLELVKELDINPTTLEIRAYLPDVRMHLSRWSVTDARFFDMLRSFTRVETCILRGYEPKDPTLFEIMFSQWPLRNVTFQGTVIQYDRYLAEIEARQPVLETLTFDSVQFSGFDRARTKKLFASPETLRELSIVNCIMENILVSSYNPIQADIIEGIVSADELPQLQVLRISSKGTRYIENGELKMLEFLTFLSQRCPRLHTLELAGSDFIGLKNDAVAPGTGIIDASVLLRLRHLSLRSMSISSWMIHAFVRTGTPDKLRTLRLSDLMFKKHTVQFEQPVEVFEPYEIVNDAGGSYPIFSILLMHLLSCQKVHTLDIGCREDINMVREYNHFYWTRQYARDLAEHLVRVRNLEVNVDVLKRLYEHLKVEMPILSFDNLMIVASSGYTYSPAEIEQCRYMAQYIGATQVFGTYIRTDRDFNIYGEIHTPVVEIFLDQLHRMGPSHYGVETNNLRGLNEDIYPVKAYTNIEHLWAYVSCYDPICETIYYYMDPIRNPFFKKNVPRESARAVKTVQLRSRITMYNIYKPLSVSHIEEYTEDFWENAVRFINAFPKLRVLNVPRYTIMPSSEPSRGKLGSSERFVVLTMTG